jgi:hypothetical protein
VRLFITKLVCLFRHSVVSQSRYSWGFDFYFNLTHVSTGVTICATCLTLMNNFFFFFCAEDVNYVCCVILTTNCDDLYGPDWATEESEFDFLRGQRLFSFAK